MTQKQMILNYCSQFSPSEIEHMEYAIENKRLIEEQTYRYLNGCPSNYGAEDHIGFCETTDDSGLTTKETYDLCEACWKKALGVNEDAG